MRNRSEVVVMLVALLVPLLAARAARADAVQEARRHFDRAVGLVDDGQLEGALVEFERSYELTHNFVVLYNIGQVLVSLARPVEAYDTYQSYLTQGQDKIAVSRRAEVEREMARQKARIATVELRVLPDGALVRVDGKDIGRAPISTALRVAVGKHTVAATAQGCAPAANEITVAGEDHKFVSLALARVAIDTPTLQPVAAPPVAPMSAAPVASAAYVAPPAAELGAMTTPASQPMSKLRIAGIVMGAAGVAGIAAGTTFWLVAESRHTDAMNVYQSNYPKAQSLQSEAQSYATGASISLIAGGALVAGGVGSFILGAPDKTAPSPGLHAYLLPSLAPGIAGLSAGGTW